MPLRSAQSKVTCGRSHVPIGLSACGLLALHEDSLSTAFAAHEDHESSSPGGFHPQALTEPEVNLSLRKLLIYHRG